MTGVPEVTQHDLATLEIPLVEGVPADLLASLLGSLGTLYFFDLWLDLAADAPYPGAFPDAYAPLPEEMLWISRLEVGSPNLLRLIGKRRHILAIAGLLASVLAVPKGVVDVTVGLAQAQQIRVDTELKRLEIEEKRLDILTKARALHDAGRISPEALKHKIEDYPKAMDGLALGANLISTRDAIAVGRPSSL